MKYLSFISSWLNGTRRVHSRVQTTWRQCWKVWQRIKAENRKTCRFYTGLYIT